MSAEPDDPVIVDQEPSSELLITYHPNRAGVRVQLNGRNIEKAITSVTVGADADGAVAHIELPIHRLDLTGARLYMTDETRQFLIDAGWTPPEPAR